MNKNKNTTGIKMLKEIQDLYNISLSYSGFYSPISFQPDTNSLNREEHARLMEDIGSRRYNLLDYISFAIDMSKQNNKSEADLYKRIVSKLFKSNEKKLNFSVDQHELLTLRASDFNNDIGDILEYVINFYDKWEDTAIQLKTIPYYKILYDDLKKYKGNIKEHVTLYKKHLLKNLLLESIMEEHSINEGKTKDLLKKGLIYAALIEALYGGYQSIKDNPIKDNTRI